ncbi:hypothetical protein [Streptomyces sp. NPDC001530]|uniref:hypothetical protein n=1 Tax=Streptomyces sp. NPDC001530 TaxID=3364582 RepID=UPI00368E24E9
MGSFYGNVLVARACEEVVPLLGGAASGAGDEGIPGYALPVGPRHTVIYPDPETGAPDLAGPLSRLLGAPALGMYVFDSDVLLMSVYEDGELRHHYDSYPGYFDEGETDEDGEPVATDDFFDNPTWPDPVGVDPEAFLPLAAGPVDRAALESVLRVIPLDPEDGEDGRYVFANDQHYDVMATLGLNAPRLSTGFGYLSSGELPYETAADELVVLGGAARP